MHVTVAYVKINSFDMEQYDTDKVKLPAGRRNRRDVPLAAGDYYTSTAKARLQMNEKDENSNKWLKFQNAMI